MSHKRSIKLIIKVALFTIILILGTLAALVTHETTGLARVDLPEASSQRLTTVSTGNVLYAGAVSRAEDTADRLTTNLYRSLDHGRTWQVVGAGPETALNVLAVRPGSESILYAGGAGGPLATSKNLWRSEDGGRSWHRYNLNLPADPNQMLPTITALAVDPHRPGTLYVGTGGQGVYRFEENRLGYELVGGQTLANGHVRDLVVGPAGSLYALTGGGLFATAGDTWQPLDSLPDFPLSLLAEGADELLYAGTASSGVYRSTDGGKSWQNVSVGLEASPGAALRITALAADTQNLQRLVAATAYGLGSRIAPGHLYRSDNGGTNWIKIATLDSVVNNLTFDNDTIHAATSQGMLRFEKSFRVNLDAAASTSLAELPALTQPSGIQLLILLLTLTLAGLAFLAPLDKVLARGWFK